MPIEAVAFMVAIIAAFVALFGDEGQRGIAVLITIIFLGVALMFVDKLQI